VPGEAVRGRLRALARGRLLDPCPAAVQRLEQSVIRAMLAADWVRAARLLAFRQQLSSQLGDSEKDMKMLARFAQNIEQARKMGLGPSTEAEMQLAREKRQAEGVDPQPA